MSITESFKVMVYIELALLTLLFRKTWFVLKIIYKSAVWPSIADSKNF